ncbi:hypothetical protein [Cloacibacterium sp.]|uniref:hypothetical protein n=1 Tax=Cloacibacterium sp. TaxID=1913682 RepID=UPI0035AE896B
MDDNYFDKSPNKTTGFYFAVVFLLLLSLLSIGVDATEFGNHKDVNIPLWFFYVIFSVDTLLIISLLGIYFYRKLGVILYPFAVVVHYYLHEYYLSTMLYSDLFNLFCYIGLGLLTIIPKWKFYK